MKKFDEINIVPFLDIMLVLLAIVLVTASFITQGKIQVNVPKSSHNVTMKADDLAKLLTITDDGKWYFNDKPIDHAQLEQEIAKWDKSQKVTLKVDAATPFQQFVNVTNLFSKYEIKNVAIVTIKEEGQ
ncbi:TonB system transport protein ExbD [Spirabiliibacterium falconis]|uniref:TonB system transport protein ExbD n=1 Tax=Spirabiliibacterium falconis TaxID=572023 RepID=UPI001AAC778D|nr:TonB system transport protein ExbD [Spirabiliibacterium falconis]MBE2894964.1 TonB system transport protein ExbD [Spirabiliibacterium falconis]